MDKNKDFPNVWHAILILAILFGVQLFMGALLHDLGVNISHGDPRYGGIITIFSCGIIFSVLMSYKNISYKQLFNPSPHPTKSLLLVLIIPLIIVSCGGIVLISDLDRFVVQQFPMSQNDIEMFDRLMGGGPISIITVCILAPFIEEMLFRGIFLKSFIYNYSTFNAVVFSSLLFAVVHFNVYQTIDAYIIGTFLGWLYVITQSLWPCIFAHASFNLASTLYYEFYGNIEKSLDVTKYHSPIILIMAALLVLGGIAIIYKVTESFNRKMLKSI